MNIVEKKLIVKNKLGLHARPAASFVQVANKFNANITVTKDEQVVNGKSIMGILMLAAEQGSSIVITALGDDAQAAVEELEKIIINEDLEKATELHRPAHSVSRKEVTKGSAKSVSVVTKKKEARDKK